MSASIDTKKSNFVIFGHSHDYTLNNSGEGKIPSYWYDADGNEYEFDLMDAHLPFDYPDGDSASSYSIRFRDTNTVWSQYYAYSDDLGRNNRQFMKSKDYLLFDVVEDDNWLNPDHLVGLSARNLITLGLLEDRAGSTVKLFKNEPNSNIWVQCTITAKKNNIFATAIPTYSSKDQTGYGISFLVSNPLHPQYSFDLRVDDLDIALCRLTKHDGTVGLGFCGTFALIYTSYGAVREIWAQNRVWTHDRIFDCLDLYYGEL